MKISEAAEQAALKRGPESDVITAESRTIKLPKTRIHTLPQLVEHCEVDLDVWEVTRFECNKWEMGYKDKNDDGQALPLFQVFAAFKPRKAVIETKRIIEMMWEKAATHAPSCYVHRKRSKSKSGNVVEHSIVDIHHGALIWGKETGGADWDLKTSVAVHKEAFQNLIWRSDNYDPEAALLVMGHDRQNSDNRQGQTEHGTQQFNDSRYTKIFDTSCDLAIWEIDTSLDRYGVVEVKIVPGNHDPLASWHLGKALSLHYAKVPQVKIDNGPNPKKYWEYGTNMLLLTHGQNRPKSKLENFGTVMASEQPSMWGRTRWRECHTGHVHHKTAFEMAGAIIRSLSCLRPPCFWSNEMNFTGTLQAAESFVWNKSLGMIGTAVYSVLDKRVQ